MPAVGWAASVVVASREHFDFLARQVIDFLARQVIVITEREKRALTMLIFLLNFPLLYLA